MRRNRNRNRNRNAHTLRAGLLATLLLLLVLVPLSAAWAAEQRLLIPPRLSDERLAESDPPHLVIYNSDKPASPLLLWLAGTGGAPATGPRLFYGAALQQGFRLIALSYRDTPAVSQVCTGPALRAQSDCAGRMRQQRVWGDPQSGLIADRPEDAIVPRFTRLLQHLARSDAAGAWTQYLDGDEPRWARVTLAGQSQGGGMAAYLAQTRQVAGVIMFSGGWDHRAGGDMADWYSRSSATPSQRWHATFHADEAQAATMERIYRRLGLPAAQIHTLSEPMLGRRPHTEGISNPAYQPLWERMLQGQQ